MNIYEEVKKEVEEKNKLKVGDVCAYVGDVPWLGYSNCVIHEVRDDGNYMARFPDGRIEIVAPNELAKMPGIEWREPNIASSLPYVPYQYYSLDKSSVFEQPIGGFKLKEDKKTMKKEFKIGDKVRCVRDDLASFGKVGEVVSTFYPDDGGMDIGVKFSDSDWTVHFKNSWSIEKVEDIKFKKGDRVVCLKQPTDSNHEMFGLKGTVLNVDSFGWVLVEFDDNIHGHEGFYPNNGKLGHCWDIKKEHLRLISKEEEKNMLSFKMGDIVEILDGPGKGLHGKIIGCRGTLGSSDIEAVIDIDGDEYHFSTKRLKLVSKKDEKGEKKMMFNFKVVGAYPNKKKGILAVKFNDGEVIKLACHDDDNFDINVGVALAMAYKSCGGKNAFRRNVEKVTQEVKSKEDREDKVFGDYNAKSFGRIMKAKRIKMKMPQNLLAQIVGANQSNISEYESGKYLPRKELRQRIINALGL